MKTIELKHWAAYLPFKLKLGVYASLSTFQLVVSRKEEGYTITDVLKQSTLKPILYPLNWLDKEIEHNGEKFVPLIELAIEYLNMSRDYLNEVKKEWYAKDNYYGFTINNREEHFYFCCDKGSYNQQFYFGYEIRSGERKSYLPKYPKYQLNMFQRLFEWHFNVFNLPKHLYIDKSKL